MDKGWKEKTNGTRPNIDGFILQVTITLETQNPKRFSLRNKPDKIYNNNKQSFQRVISPNLVNLRIQCFSVRFRFHKHNFFHSICNWALLWWCIFYPGCIFKQPGYGRRHYTQTVTSLTYSHTIRINGGSNQLFPSLTSNILPDSSLCFPCHLWIHCTKNAPALFPLHIDSVLKPIVTLTLWIRDMS